MCPVRREELGEAPQVSPVSGVIRTPARLVVERTEVGVGVGAGSLEHRTPGQAGAADPVEVKQLPGREVPHVEKVSGTEASRSLLCVMSCRKSSKFEQL